MASNRQNASLTKSEMKQLARTGRLPSRLRGKSAKAKVPAATRAKARRGERLVSHDFDGVIVSYLDHGA